MARIDRRNGILKTGLLLSVILVCLLSFGALRPVSAASKTTMVVGQTKQIRKKNVTGFQSSRPRVATVSSTGLITAVRKGSCRITANRNGKQLTWKIKVEAPALSADSRQLEAGGSFRLTLRGTTQKFKWSVSDSSILKIRRKKKYRFQVTGLRNGIAYVTVSRGACSVSCKVVVGSGVTDEELAAQKLKKAQEEAKKKQEEEAKKKQEEEAKKSQIQTLYLDGNVFKQMTWNRTDTAKYVSSVSSYGQSAPLYIHKDGGDGLENIWADTNNGAVGVKGVKLSDAAVKGTIAKACLWARAISDSPWHGYDYGHSYPDAALLYTFGQAKANALGTGDYCCSTIPLCAYYFAGVNVLGENLGGSNAKYIPHTTKLFYEGDVTFYQDGKLQTCDYRSNYEWRIFLACGFTDVYSEYAKNKSGFEFQPGDVITANGHTQLVLTAGTSSTAETVQALGPDKKGKMPVGGDQSGNEITRSWYVHLKPEIKHILRFTGEGVRLNTVGLVS